jgi:hypothetical protein
MRWFYGPTRHPSTTHAPISWHMSSQSTAKTGSVRNTNAGSSYTLPYAAYGKQTGNAQPTSYSGASIRSWHETLSPPCICGGCAA